MQNADLPHQVIVVMTLTKVKAQTKICNPTVKVSKLVWNHKGFIGIKDMYTFTAPECDESLITRKDV